jgi:hypothetical protein
VSLLTTQGFAGKREASLSNREFAKMIRPLPFSSEPLTVRIGVTGHRTLRNPERIGESVGQVLADLDRRLGCTLHRYRILSPLAEGADRLVAKCVLEWKGSGESATVLPPRLDIVLPMPEGEYFETFSSERRAESIQEFQSFLAHADPPKILPKAGSRKEAYERVGQYVVQNCDVLIAVWDGKRARGKGGTAEIVEFAKSSNRRVFSIDPASGAFRRITNRRDFVSQVDFLNEYNGESPGEPPVYQEVEKRLGKLKREAKAAGLDPDVLSPLQEAILPHGVKASRLARRYQSHHFWSGTAAYCLSALAVLTAALGALTFRSHPWLFGAEAIEILPVILLTWLPWFQGWQRKWIDYRYLAERLRASCFLYVAGLSDETSEPPPDMQLSWLPDSWVANAIREAWRTLPKAPKLPHEEAEQAETEARIGKFIFTAWIDDQRKYYDRAGRNNRERHEWLELFLKLFVGLTLLVAIFHWALEGFGRASAMLAASLKAALSKVSPRLARLLTRDWLSMIAVTLPAFAGALAGISVFRHFNRNAERYESMSRYLQAIGQQMSGETAPTAATPHRAPHLSPLQQLVRQADRSMAHEHQGWRTVFGVHLPGPG